MTDSEAVRTALHEAAARRRVRSATLVSPTSASARPASFRPTIARLDAAELGAVDEALSLILGL